MKIVKEFSGSGHLNTTSENFIHYTHIPGDTNSLSHPSIRGIFEDKKGILWVGGYRGLNKIDRNKGRITHYLPPQDVESRKLDSNLIYTIIGDPDYDNILWIGTEGFGLYNFDKTTRNIKHYVYQPDVPDPYASHTLSNDFIHDLYADTRGLLWIATDNGLNRLNKATDEITVYKHNPDNA